MSEQKNFMVVETPVSVDENGAVRYAQEVLIEGDIVERGGNRFRVVKNEKGALYKQSLDLLGQVGTSDIKKMTPAEFRDQLIKAAEEQLSVGFPEKDFVRQVAAIEDLPLLGVVAGLVQGTIPVVGKRTDAGDLMELARVMSEFKALAGVLESKLRLVAKRVSQYEDLKLDLHGISKLGEETRLDEVAKMVKKTLVTGDQVVQSIDVPEIEED